MRWISILFCLFFCFVADKFVCLLVENKEKIVWTLLSTTEYILGYCFSFVFDIIGFVRCNERWNKRQILRIKRRNGDERTVCRLGSVQILMCHQPKCILFSMKRKWIFHLVRFYRHSFIICRNIFRIFFFSVAHLFLYSSLAQRWAKKDEKMQSKLCATHKWRTLQFSFSFILFSKREREKKKCNSFNSDVMKIILRYLWALSYIIGYVTIFLCLAFFHLILCTFSQSFSPLKLFPHFGFFQLKLI